ncbi:MAG: glutathione S-transferase family protein [Aliidongia sp.]
MLTIWGRATSSNVQKVLWCCDELGLAYERVDAGRQFGKVDEPDYRMMNPNGLVPTLIDGEVTVWESNSVMRYLCNRYGGDRLYPADPAPRAAVDQWLDWQLSTMAPAIAPVFWALVRPPAGGTDPATIPPLVQKLAAVWAVLDRQLAARPYIASSNLSLADLALGNSARRWFAFAFERPELPHLAAWFDRISTRPGFRTHVMTPIV